jgi:hypothetical protein
VGARAGADLQVLAAAAGASTAITAEKLRCFAAWLGAWTRWCVGTVKIMAVPCLAALLTGVMTAHTSTQSCDCVAPILGQRNQPMMLHRSHLLCRSQSACSVAFSAPSTGSPLGPCTQAIGHLQGSLTTCRCIVSSIDCGPCRVDCSAANCSGLLLLLLPATVAHTAAC